MQQVFYALNAHRLALALDLPEAKENWPFVPPTDSYWMAVFFAPATDDPVTLGRGGINVISGFYQIDINAPQNKGVGPLLGYLHQVSNHFRAGTVISGDYGRVVIDRCDFSPGSSGSSSGNLNPLGYTKTITVYWTAYSTRGNT